MAQYNHEILVNYLRDVYSLELLYHKIDHELDVSGPKIDHELNLISQYKNATMPVMKDPEPCTPSASSLAAYAVVGFIAAMLFAIPVIGFILGIAGILFDVFIIWMDKSCSDDITENRRKKCQTEFEEALSKYETLQWAYNKYNDTVDDLIDEHNAGVAHLDEIEEKLKAAYSVNIIPNKYRDIYVAYYLYDYFSSSRETDLDKVLQTMLLDQIVERLDRIIDQQEEIILNQRMELALQEKQAAQLQQNHRAQLQAIARVEQNQQLQNDYLAMIDTNTRITNFFVTADYINKYL